MDIATNGSLNLKYWPCMIETTHLSDEPEDYWPSDQSSSYLIFAIECFPENEHRYFFKHPKDSIVSLYGGDTDSLIKRNNDNVLVAHRFLIEDFFSRISVNEKLIEFANIVKRETAYTLIE